MTTILVTGHAGFIGSNLVRRLFRELGSGTIVGIDNLNCYYDPSLKEYRLREIEQAVPEGIRYTFVKGIYRPTQESMMRHNDSPFNAPSRKAIYDRVLLLGEDKEISTLDEFAAFDEQHRPTRWNYAITRAPWQQRYLASPIIKWTK